jgi:hypothetical protein
VRALPDNRSENCPEPTAIFSNPLLRAATRQRWGYRLFLTPFQGRKCLDIGLDRRDILTAELLKHAERHDIASSAGVRALATREHRDERRFRNLRVRASGFPGLD